MNFQLISYILLFFRLPVQASRVYGNTKLANVLFVRELSRRLRPLRVAANALHPGAVQTGLFRHLALVGDLVHFFVGLLYKTPKVRKNATLKYPNQHIFFYFYI